MKAIIRESIAMIILIFALMLILITVFFDYIKENSIEISGATYEMSKEEQKILKEKQNYLASQNKITLSSGYTVSEDDLQAYKSNGDLKLGQSNPFDETYITEIIHDSEGSIHYQLSDPRNVTTNTSSGAAVVPSQNESTYFQNDISAPSAGTGELISQPRADKTK